MGDGEMMGVIDKLATIFFVVVMGSILVLLLLGLAWAVLSSMGDRQ